MGKKKKKFKKAASAIVPVNKKGIKLGTLLQEASLIGEVWKRKDRWSTDPGQMAVDTFTTLFDWNQPAGRMNLLGIGIVLAGRATKTKGVGIWQFS